MFGIALKGKEWVSIYDKHTRYTIDKPFSHGFVYFISSDHYKDALKIGKTRQKPDSRRGGMQVGSPYQLIIYAAYYTDKYEKLETLLHKVYNPQRIRGEWYSIENVPHDLMRHFGCVKCDAFGRTNRTEICKTLNIIENLPDSKYRERRKLFLENIKLLNE